MMLTVVVFPVWVLRKFWKSDRKICFVILIVNIVQLVFGSLSEQCTNNANTLKYRLTSIVPLTQKLQKAEQIFSKLIIL